MTGCLEACQKRREELVAIRSIQLKINDGCRRVQNELLVNPPTDPLTLDPLIPLTTVLLRRMK
jgi:hypothetical protein